MKTIDYNVMNVGFKVESVDFEKSICDLRVYSGRKSKLFTDVYISSLLKYRMSNEKYSKYYEVGKKYSSANNEKFRKKNPFQLIRYGSIDTPKHLLTVVEDAGSKTVSMGTDVFGNEMKKRVFNPWYKATHYRRFRNKCKVVKPETVTQ